MVFVIAGVADDQERAHQPREDRHKGIALKKGDRPGADAVRQSAQEQESRAGSRNRDQGSAFIVRPELRGDSGRCRESQPCDASDPNS
ncbi:hypothetical protein PVT25_00815 [Paenarthrobacter ureafaciens]|uniref:hypothetical protein n=1 Tax=Paenarthrobacter ureafaciens TaxID=37931 RepID=UPI00292EBF98|nr:hypothetical protein [Paenarthrobacter ureafaciens]WNZ04130.1 hypothetical protein PVT25_00815 [Paenarthrobacter ureafaciens]